MPGPGITESGVAGFELWRAVDGRQPRRLVSTTKRSRRVRLRRGHRYHFFTIAIDRAGNRELPPTIADVRFTVGRR